MNAALLLSLALVASATTSRSGASEPAVVAVSVAPHAWLVRQIAGPLVEVEVVTSSWNDPESFQPTDSQVSRISRSDLFLKTGAAFEVTPWFRSIETRVPAVRDLRGDFARPHQDHSHEEGAGADDPHTWVSPQQLLRHAENATEALKKLLPHHRETLEGGLRRVRLELESLDRDLREILAPARGRAFVVYHPAWGAFARQYGLRQIAVERAGSAPADRDVTSLLRDTRSLGTTTIFLAPQDPPHLLEPLAQALDARIQRLDPLARDVPTNLRKVARQIVDSIPNPGAAQ